MKNKTNLDIVLEEMFKRVGDKYTPTKVKEKDWYLKNEWSEEEQSNFINWLTNFLYENKEARKEICRYPHLYKTKSGCKKIAYQFILHCGWKTKLDF